MRTAKSRAVYQGPDSVSEVIVQAKHPAKHSADHTTDPWQDHKRPAQFPIHDDMQKRDCKNDANFLSNAVDGLGDRHGGTEI
jgi:hypothetical protein